MEKLKLPQRSCVGSFLGMCLGVLAEENSDEVILEACKSLLEQTRKAMADSEAREHLEQFIKRTAE